MGTHQPFYRHFSFDTFRHFLPLAVLKKVRNKIGINRRSRSLGLEGFIWLGLFIAAHTTLPNLQQIFNLAGSLSQTIIPLHLVSVSAFCQYRVGFPLKAMLCLWRSLLGRFSTLSCTLNQTWRGLKLCALDGSSVNLPEALWPHFGSLGGWGPGPAQGFLMIIYNLSWCTPTAVRFSPAVNEGRPQLILKHLLHHLKAGDLLLIDAGLYSLEIFCLLLNRGVQFLIPMRSSGKPKLIKRFAKNDGLYQIKASRYWKNNPVVSEYLIVRIITYQRPGFRPRRLVTSLLEPDIYPAEEIVQIYHRRWEIETFFRELKHTLQLTHWHARSLPALYSELLFQMVLVTLTRLVMAQASKERGLLPNQLSFGRCLADVKRALAIIPFSSVFQWLKSYDELISRLKDYLIDVRPGRRFERDTHKRRLASRARYISQIQSKEKNHVA